MATKIGRKIENVVRNPSEKKPRAGSRDTQQTGADLSYEKARALATSKDTDVRCALAAMPDAQPEILYYLADDPAPEVRRKLASNSATPSQAHLILAKDEDLQVRGDLAAKIARLAPGLNNDEQDRVRRATYETLELLARDQAIRVRQILAEALKDVADAPSAVIRRLARDLEDVVSCPVLEFSPVLSDADLLEIIASSPMSARLGAISRRESVSEQVCDAIASCDDTDAIAHLLANPSAQIREETLDQIIDQAAEVEQWHVPLVNRPTLSQTGALRLAEFVADNLLETLVARQDLDAATAEAVRSAVRDRLNGPDGDAAASESGAPSANSGSYSLVDDDDDVPKSTPSEAREAVHKLDQQGKLTEGVVVEAIDRRDPELVFAALARLSGVKRATIAKAFGRRSAKGIVALVWMSGLSPRLATDLQRKMGNIRSADLIHPRGELDFALTEDDMRWQIEFLEEL